MISTIKSIFYGIVFSIFGLPLHFAIVFPFAFNDSGGPIGVFWAAILAWLTLPYLIYYGFFWLLIGKRFHLNPLAYVVTCMIVPILIMLEVISA